MASIRCPACGREGNAPTVFIGKSVRCPKCGEKIQLAGHSRRPWVTALAVLLAVAGFGTASYFGFRHFQAEAEGPPPDVAQGDTTDPRAADATEPAGESAAEIKKREELLAFLAERRRKEAERRKQEEEEQRLAQEKALALAKEKERQEQEEREKQEMVARLEKERLLAEKKNPSRSATLEEITKTPEKFYGTFLTVDRVVVKGTAIDRHKELGRFTLGVTTERNTYFSRVPLSGLILSTTDKIAADLKRKIGDIEPFPRVKLYCEVRKWERKLLDSSKLCPEAHIYRIEVYNASGKVETTMEDWSGAP